MNENDSDMDVYTHFYLGKESRLLFLRSLIEALNFDFAGPQELAGLSGLHHGFEAIATRGRTILLVVGGAEVERRTITVTERASDPNAPILSDHLITPREAMEHWRNTSLLSALDVQNAIVQEGYLVDLMFFQNIRQISDHWAITHWNEWIAKKGLTPDTGFSQSGSRSLLPKLPSFELARVASSIGACFLSLNDIPLDTISKLTDRRSRERNDVARAVCRELRLQQYFSPPTDELILAGCDFAKISDSSMISRLYETSMQLGHPPTSNEVVPQANFRDPVATAKELEKCKYIEFEASTELTQDGRKITQKICKSAQGSFVIKVLRTIGLPELSKAIIKAIKKW